MRMAYHTPGAKSEEYQTAFGGYNHTENCSELEFFEMKNMSSDLFPILTPRKKRSRFKLAGETEGVKAILAKNKLCHIAGNTFYIDNVPVEDFYVEPMYDESGAELPISLVSMGAYVIIIPQKQYVNTANTKDCGVVEKKAEIKSPLLFLTDTDGSFSYDIENEYPKTREEGEKRGFYLTEIEANEVTETVLMVKTDAGWIQKEPCFGISNLYGSNFPETYGKTDLKTFKKGTVVTLSGLDSLNLDGEKTVQNVRDLVGSDLIIFRGFIPENSEAPSSVTIVQQVPNMDFVIENNNRLWGCRYGLSVDGEFVNEIYASAQGDFTLWNDFSGEASDSYTVPLGSDGPFTGAVKYGDNPIFFKEHCFHRIYGTLPENYQLQTYDNDGLQAGSGKSIAIVENVLFYKGADGFYAFDGTIPQMISEPLGKEPLFDAVCGSCDQKYYASVRDRSGRYDLYVYDVAKNLWHKEDNLRLLDCTSRGTDLYCLTEKDGVIKISSMEQSVDEQMTWYAESGIIGKSSPDKKVIQKLKIRAEISPTAYVQVMIEYDSSGNFEPVFLMEGRQLQSFTIPIRVHRCDHFKILFMGRGSAKIYSLSKVIAKRSDK